MNNRDYKPFALGGYYHVYNRGNNKVAIFHDAEDYDLFLHRLFEALYPEREYQRVNGAHSHSQRNQRKPLPVGAFSLVAYCLMPNHFHLLIRQNTELPISALMSKVCGSYSKLFNKKYKRVGSLFQDQFKAVPVDENGLQWLSAYIHQNPAVAFITKSAETYPYSSYREYVGRVGQEFCVKDIILSQFKNIGAYRRFVSDSGEQIKEKKKLRVLLID